MTHELALDALMVQLKALSTSPLDERNPETAARNEQKMRELLEPIVRKAEAMRRLEKNRMVDIRRSATGVQVLIYPEPGTWHNDEEYWKLVKKFTAPDLITAIEKANV